MRMPGPERLGYFKQRVRLAGDRLAASLRKARGDAREPASGERFDEAARHYYASAYDAPIAMFLAGDTHLRRRPAHDPRMEWRQFAKGGVEIADLPGDHYTLIREPNVVRLAGCLTAALAPGESTMAAARP
jgi:thioesterase domain-containing protein